MKPQGRFFLSTSKLVHLFGEGAEPSGKDILTGLLSTVYKRTDEQIAEILKDGAKPEDVLSAIVNLDKERIKGVQTQKEKDSFNNGYKKAKAEVLTAYEAEIKETYGIEGDATGLDLLSEVVAAKAKESGGASTEEQIRESPTYKALEKKMNKAVADAKAESAKAINDLKAGFAKEQTFATVGKNALQILNDLGPVMPANAKVAATHQSNFLNALKGYEYEMDAEGNITVSKEGKALEDEHGNALSYEDHVKKVAGTHFEFKQNNEGGNAGNNNNNNNGGGNDGKPKPPQYPAGVARPKNADELAKVLSDTKLKPADKRIIMDTYKAETAKK